MQIIGVPKQLKPGSYHCTVKDVSSKGGKIKVRVGNFFPEKGEPASGISLDAEELIFLGFQIRDAMEMAEGDPASAIGWNDDLIRNLYLLLDKINVALKTLQPPKKAVSKRPRTPQGRSEAVRRGSGPPRRRKA